MFVLSQVLIPVIILTLNLSFLKFGTTPDGDLPSLKIDISPYGKNYLPINIKADSFQNNQTLQKMSNYFSSQFKDPNMSIVFNLNNANSIYKNNCSDHRCDSIEKYLSVIGDYNFNVLDKEHYSAVDFLIKNSSQNVEITGHFNNQPFHILPLTLNLITNTLFKFYTNSSTSSINLINHPLPRDESDKLRKASGFNLKILFISLGINFGFSFLISSFAIFLIKERVSGAKHLQYLNGCNSYIFWLSAFIWDFLNYIIPVIFVQLILLVKINFS